MKKIVSLIIISVMMIAMLIPVQAAGATDILKGTPEMDGVLDEIYSQSAKKELDNFNFYVWGDFGETTVTATAYFLWDENYLYVCTVVNDKTISSSGQAYIDANQPNPWQNDAVENWFLDNGTKMKIHNDAHGLTMFGDPVGGLTFDIAKALYKTKIDGTQYVVETALPLPDMKVGKEIGFAIQVNDIANGTNEAGSASGTQTPDATTFKTIAEEVVYPEPEVVEEVAPVDAAAPVDTAADAPVAAAQTSDTAVIISILALCAAAFAVFASKKALVK